MEIGKVDTHVCGLVNNLESYGYLEREKAGNPAEIGNCT